MRVLICGGRDFADKRLAMDTMATVERTLGSPTCVIQGGARGADAIGKAWAEWKGLPVFECRANWDKFGKAAGGIRNQWMLDHGKPELVVAFPGGTGMADMVRRAQAAGVKVLDTRQREPCAPTRYPTPA